MEWIDETKRPDEGSTVLITIADGFPGPPEGTALTPLRMVRFEGEKTLDPCPDELLTLDVALAHAKLPRIGS
jgi:hypothetical protein